MQFAYYTNLSKILFKLCKVESFSWANIAAIGLQRTGIILPKNRLRGIILMSSTKEQSGIDLSGLKAKPAELVLPEHHVGTAGVLGPRFKNPWNTYEERTFSHVWKWHKEKRKAGIPMEPYLAGNKQPTEEDFRRAFPLNPVDWGALAAPPADGVQAVWVGHATVLVQLGGLTFITDPVFSQRCAPVQFAGPKRVVAPALTCTEPQMPALDFVLLSHNHYDHLDTNSVRALNRRYGKALTWYVPLGMRPWFTCEGVCGNVIEMDWWQSVVHSSTSGRSVTVTMVPAQHWSARGILDRFRTLWGGYIVTASPQATGSEARLGSAAENTAAADADATRPLRFYFVGDTGYCSVFKEIGERFGPIDLAAIPIGAYEPRWFMKPQHTNAEEALQIALDVKATVSIGIHTATWSLTDEPLDEPPIRLQAAVQERGLPESSFVTLQHGEMAIVRNGKLRNKPRLLPVKA